MKRREFSTTLVRGGVAAAGLASGLPLAYAQAGAPVAGKDYLVISPPVPTPANGKVEVIETGCRNRCDYGPSMNVYPGPWFYNELTPEAIREIVVGHLAGGEPVARWLFRPALASGRDPDRARGRSGW